MDIIDESKIIIQPLQAAWVHNESIHIDMLRLDLIHPVISGNKWYKLRQNLEQAKISGSQSILTFGGAYSNHLVAAAAAANASGISAIGIVRGNDDTALTSTLTQCREMGMQLHFISREEYKQKNDEVWLSELSAKFNDPFIIPEGGANEWGRLGAEDIAAQIPEGYTHVCVSAGTGTTFIGLRNALPLQMNVIAFAPMRDGQYLEEEIESHLKRGKDGNWWLFDNWHFGGFAKSNNELISFMNNFYKINDCPLDIVYTGKMMYGVQELIRTDFFAPGSKVLCIHTGGLQGNSSVQDMLSY